MDGCIQGGYASAVTSMCIHRNHFSAESYDHNVVAVGGACAAAAVIAGTVDVAVTAAVVVKRLLKTCCDRCLNP